MKNRVTKYLLMGALAIGMTSVAIASEEQESASKDKQLCFQINGDINNSTQIDKIYLTVNSVGVATGNGCFYSISDPSATPSCSPVIGNVTGKFPEAFLSLTGNWQRTMGSEVVSEDTKVSAHYDFKKPSGEGIAKTLKTIGNAPAQEVNSSEGSVSRIACPKPVVELLKHLPNFSSFIIAPSPMSLAVPYQVTSTTTACHTTSATSCSKNTPSSATCATLYIPGSTKCTTGPSGGAAVCSTSSSTNCGYANGACSNSGGNCQ